MKRSRSNEHFYDVAIIGAGVVGCAMARKFTLEGLQVVVIEKAADLLDGASKGNSGILHTGFDAPPGSLEWACMRDGHAEYMAIKERLQLPTLDDGAIVVAFNRPDMNELEGLREKAIRNGVDGATLLSRSELLSREPNLSAQALAGLFVPGECVIDPWSTPLAYLQQAVSNGAAVRFREELLNGEFDGGGWRLAVTSGEMFARTVVNCAGNFGDIVDRRVLGDATFLIRPRKGQFVVFDKPASNLIRSIILPVPTEQTKGVLLARTVFGNLLTGPTAEDQADRQHAGNDLKTVRELIQKAIAMIPALADASPIACYAGLRPGSEKPGYRIRVERERGWITVGGIRSTGLTSALGLAKHVFACHQSEWPQSRHPKTSAVWPQMPQLAEGSERDWQKANSGTIICECENVTEREVEAALHGELGARDLGGLKRRTRVCLGHCQGERCLARLAVLAAGRLEQFDSRARHCLAAIQKSEHES